MVKLGCDLVTEKPTSTTRGNGPCLNILRVAPNQITESAFMGNLLSTSYDPDLVDSSNFGAQATMNAEDLTIDDSCEDEEIENLAARFPD
jgi:hypothetical protein